MSFILRFLSGILACAVLASWPMRALAQQEGPWQTYGTENGEWRSYAGNIAGQKYSPLDQIDETNFADLTIAWRWQFMSRN